MIVTKCGGDDGGGVEDDAVNLGGVDVPSAIRTYVHSVVMNEKSSSTLQATYSIHRLAHAATTNRHRVRRLQDETLTRCFGGSTLLLSTGLHVACDFKHARRPTTWGHE